MSTELFMHGGSVFFRNDMVDCCMHIFNAFPDAMQIEEIPRAMLMQACKKASAQSMSLQLC
jgi:hypothetical protein